MIKKAVWVLIFLLGIFPYFASSVQAQDASSSSIPESVSYDMPYPGLLPDNPLYFFKTLRDKIVGILIADNQKRAEFNLLNSDKRLAAGIALVNKKNYSLGVTTISKSNNYFHEAMSALNRVKATGQDVDLLSLKMKTAAEKHIELLREVEESVPESDIVGFTKEQHRLENFLKELTPSSK